MTTAGLADNLIARGVAIVRRRAECPSTPQELAGYMRSVLGVSLPSTPCCSQHTAPFDAFAAAYFAREPIAVWKASRGFGGKSYMLAALALVEAATLGAEVRVLGGSADQSENVVRYTAGWTSGTGMATQLSGGPGYREAGVTRSRVRLRGGGMVDALAASSRAVRGPHPSRLRIDEADELDVRILDAALGQTMARPGIAAQTVISSTHHYSDGTMSAVLGRAAERGWPVYQWCYRCTQQRESCPDGWLDPAEIERKRAEVPAAMWAAEYDLQEPAPESRAFDPGAVERMFDPALGVFQGGPGECIEVEPPVAEGEYATGADWAKERDWTVIATLRTDVQPARLVAYERIARMPWPMMVERFDRRAQRYEGTAAFDATGIGNVVSDLLTVGARPVVLSGRIRADLLTRYLMAVEGGKIVAPQIDHPYSEHRFATVADVFGSGHLPDSVCAMALAWLGAMSKVEVTWL